jgi:hypothetical protein
MIASNFLFNFTPKELLYVKNNSSKYKLKLSAAQRMPCAYYGNMTETAGMLYTAYSTEGLIAPLQKHVRCQQPSRPEFNCKKSTVI